MAVGYSSISLIRMIGIDPLLCRLLIYKGASLKLNDAKGFINPQCKFYRVVNESILSFRILSAQLCELKFKILFFKHLYEYRKY